MKKSLSSRFKILRTTALLLRVVGWLSIFGSIALAVALWAAPTALEQLGLSGIYNSPWLSTLTVLIYGVVYAIISFALAEGIHAFLSIEENARKLREILDRK
ncbi:hypothetical protein A2V68_00010 [candidate division Kazan bacterium RBG_13_50_9]|uniref:DUF485 domain-containing protein n=1 Tax=candidate division Kazan bacterium RBG_13_50_9 TaxID=1798535 RepID=A0A1F4NRE3_UNCK3|nr:MAG: hypothetical protein A2V68_00010 [candidate division Kazan bacterium RBG_13_50_9]